MRTDKEIEHIAESHVRRQEHKLSVSGGQLRLQLVRHCDVDVPLGVYYSMRVVEPPGEILFGPGGFFVARSTGAVEEFGSGELMDALGIVYANDPTTTPTINSAVVKALFRQRSDHAIPEPPFDWGTLGGEAH